MYLRAQATQAKQNVFWDSNESLKMRLGRNLELHIQKQDSQKKPWLIAWVAAFKGQWIIPGHTQTAPERGDVLDVIWWHSSSQVKSARAISTVAQAILMCFAISGPQTILAGSRFAHAFYLITLS